MTILKIRHFCMPYNFLVRTQKQLLSWRSSSTRKRKKGVWPAFLTMCVMCNLISCIRFDDDKISTSHVMDNDATSDISNDTGPSLCEKYGGFSTVQSIAAEFSKAAQADCRLQAFFTTNRTTASLLREAECNEILFGALLRCSRDGKAIVYPGFDSKGVLCQDLSSAHKGLNISSADFDAFASVLTNVLKASNIASADIDAIKKLLNFSRDDIVERPDTGLSHACADANASLMNDSSTKDSSATDAQKD